MMIRRKNVRSASRNKIENWIEMSGRMCEGMQLRSTIILSRRKLGRDKGEERGKRKWKEMGGLLISKESEMVIQVGGEI